MTAPNTTTTSTPTPARRPPSALAAVVAYTVRSCIGRKRWLGILFVASSSLLFGLLARTLSRTPADAFAITSNGIFGLALPIAALIIGDAVMGAEIRSGVIHFTWLSPATMRTLVVGRWIGAVTVTLVTVVPCAALAAVVAGDARSALPAAVATASGAAAYVAVFIAIGCIARRAAVWSLVFVFLIERMLGEVLSGVAQWSPMWETRALFSGLASHAFHPNIPDNIPTGGGAVVRLAVIAGIALALARWRLAHIRVTGASD